MRPAVLLLLLSSVLNLSSVYTSELVDEVEPLVSVTGCILRYPASSAGITLCDYAVFSSFPQPWITEPLVVSPTDACQPFPSGLAFVQKVVLVDRGNCPFTTKARNLKDAGAIAVIVGNVEAGVLPVRMKGIGDESSVVTIPVVMVGKEDADKLKEAAARDVDGVEKAYIDVEMSAEHELAEERKRKQFLSRPSRAGRYKPVSLMELGAYMVRSGWKEDGRVYIMEASRNADRPEDFEVQYSVGEYLYNIEKAVIDSQLYFEKCVMQIVALLIDDGPFEDWEANSKYHQKEAAWEKLHKMTGQLYDVHDSSRQILATAGLVKGEGPSATLYLKKLVESLYKRKLLSTPTVLVWADSLGRIGMHEALDQAVNGEWYDNHKGKGDEEWRGMIDEVRIVLSNFISSLPTKEEKGEKKKEEEGEESTTNTPEL